MKSLFSQFFSGTPLNYARFMERSFRRMLKGLLEGEDFDLVQMEGLPVAIYLPFIRAHSRCPVSLRAHNAEHVLWQQLGRHTHSPLKGCMYSILARRIRQFERTVTRKVDYLVPISGEDQEALEGPGSRAKTLVIPAGLDLDAYPATPDPEGQPSLFFLGALDWIPNQEGLLWFVEKVWDRVRPHYPDLVFSVAGRNSPARLRKAMARHGVEFAGEIEDAREFIQKHHIWVAPLFASGGMRIKVLEGLALQKAMITSPAAARGLPAKHGQHILIATSAGEFIEQIRDLLENPERISQLGAEGRKLVEKNFNNLALTKKLYDFYREGS